MKFSLLIQKITIFSLLILCLVLILPWPYKRNISNRIFFGSVKNFSFKTEKENDATFSTKLNTMLQNKYNGSLEEIVHFNVEGTRLNEVSLYIDIQQKVHQDSINEFALQLIKDIQSVFYNECDFQELFENDFQKVKPTIIASFSSSQDSQILDPYVSLFFWSKKTKYFKVYLNDKAFKDVKFKGIDQSVYRLT